MEPFEIIKTLAPGRYTALEKVNPVGTLEARQDRSGVTTFYWRGALNRKTVRVPIGQYDSRAAPRSVKPTRHGYSIAAARQVAIDIARQHQDNREQGGYEAIRQAERDAARQAYEAQLEANEQTLERLLLMYCDHLEALGRSSHSDARSIFTLHVIEAFPRLATRAAVEIEPEDIADMMRRLLDAGKGRTANKLRSYVRAAYETAKRARLDASVPVKFKAFKIRHNPAADTVPDTAQNRADKDPLQLDDMMRYWRAIKRVPGVRGAVLRLHLLTGGQRIAQLVRLLSLDVGDGMITLFDGKGRPGSEPRAHTLPLIPAARKALAEASSGGHYALSTDGGQTHISASTVSKWAQAIMADTLSDFQLKQVRSGVETLLARIGISREIRGHLQSHGVAGVQARHYDAYDRAPEKEQALQALYNALEQRPAKVTRMRRKVAL
ncbi:MAG: integrase [Castellaniella sp.]